MKFTALQISTAARVLSNNSADTCGVDREDNWKIYGQDYINEAGGALAAIPEHVGYVRYCPGCGTVSSEAVRCCPDHGKAVMVPADVATQARAGLLASIADPVAWMTEDGRVATDETKRTAMPNASRVNFTIPLVLK